MATVDELLGPESDAKKPSVDDLLGGPPKPPASERFSMGKMVSGAIKTAAGDLVSPAEDAWKTLKADFQRSSLPKDVPDSMWGRAKQEFDKLLAVGKLPVDAFNLAMSPLTGALKAGVARPISEGLKSGLDLISPTLGKAAPTVDQTMLALSAAMPAKGAPSSAANALSSAKPGFTEARELGYVVPPVQASEKPGTIANALSTWGGKIKTNQAASVKNQAVTNEIAATELGLPADAMLDDTTFSKIRTAANTAYDAVKQAMTKLPGGRVTADNDYINDIVKLGDQSSAARADFPEVVKNPEIENLQDGLLKQDFSPDAGVDVVKTLRFKSKSNLRNWADPDKRALGLAQRDAATAVEDLIERQLTAQGDQATVSAYKDARQLIAKSHDIEAATDAAGNVDARKLAAMSAKRPFTGGLKKIADTAGAFPKAMQNPTKFGGDEKFGITDLAVGALSPRPEVLGLLIGRPIARSAALSQHIQNRLAGLSGPVVSLPGLTGTNALMGLTRGQNPPLPGPQGQLPPSPMGNALAPMQPPNQ